MTDIVLVAVWRCSAIKTVKHLVGKIIEYVTIFLVIFFDYIYIYIYAYHTNGDLLSNCNVYENLKLFYEEKFMLPKETVFELHCRDFINRHAISDKAYIKEIGKGLYLDLCAYDHSCRPNTIYNCQGFVATLIALNNSVVISDKNTTFYSYIELLSSQLQRKKLLKDTWYFDCHCERCVDPEDHILTSILCPNCPKNNCARLCIFGDHDYKDKISQIIVCPQCKNEVPKDYVLETVGAMRFIDKVFDDKEIEQECVRYCFPRNHPAVAFHLRNIGIFLNNLGRVEDAVKYFKEAEEIMVFILGADHTMAIENRVLLDQALLNLQESRELNEIAEETSLHNKTEEILLEYARHNITESDEILEEVTDIKAGNNLDSLKNQQTTNGSSTVNSRYGSKAVINEDLFSDDISSLPEHYVSFLLEMSRFPLRDIEADDEFVVLDGNEQLVPDGSKDVEVIGQIDSVKTLSIFSILLYLFFNYLFIIGKLKNLDLLLQVEVANFAFPYPGFSSAPVFAQLHLVVHGDAPMVSSPLYSTRTKNFIHWCVTKDFNHRPTFADLTKTPYYEHYNSMSNLNYLVGTFVSDILLKIENHNQRCNQ
uniref:TPR_REGION domain-containing protein n=1 Tax=Heterorhabditis bacteriophora TaxID=37862 RepID=A0A1I7XQA7_HETBA